MGKITWSRNRRVHPSLAFAVWLGLYLLGCGDSDPGVQKVIGPAGGTIESSSGAVVVIPPGALTEDVLIEIKELSVESLAAPPASMVVGGGAVALLPHGLVFAVPVSVELPARTQSNSVLRLDDERDTTWERVANPSFAASRARFEINTFSVYAPAEPDPNLPMARGVLSPPEVIAGGKIPAAFRERGGHHGDLVYWPEALSSGMFQIRRARLAETIVVEAVYEEYDELLVAAVGPDTDALYFFRPAPAMLARLPHDLSAIDLAWRDMNGFLTQFTRVQSGGVVVRNNVYVDLTNGAGSIRFPVAGGAAAALPFTLSEFCAFSPDETLAACGYQRVDLVNETSTEVKDSQGQVVGGGPVAANATAFFYMPPSSFPSVEIHRLLYVDTLPTVFATTSDDVLAAAEDGGTLYLGVQTDLNGNGALIAMDSTSAVVVGQVTMNPAPSDGFIIVQPYLYHGTSGGDLQRTRLDSIAP